MANKPEVNLDELRRLNLSYHKRFAYEIVAELRSTSSKNEKVAILEKCVGFDAFKRALYLTYCKRVRFGIKKIPEYVPGKRWGSAHSLATLLPRLDMLHTRQVTGNKAIEFLRQTLEMADPFDAAFIELVIARDLDCGIGEGLINKVFPGLIPEHPMMFCTPYDEKILSGFPFPAYFQPKHDGMRANWIYDAKFGTVEGYLRGGNPIPDTPPQIMAFITAMAQKFSMSSFVLDGELLVLGEDMETVLSRKTGNGILTKLLRETAKPQEISRVCFRAWDIVPLDKFWSGTYHAPYRERFALLAKIFRSMEWEGVRPITLTSNVEVNTLEEARSRYKEQLDLGGEGGVLKNPESPWVNGRPLHQLKMKVEDQMEMRIVGQVEGKPGTKYEGMLGNFVGESLDGEIDAEVGSGLSDKQRDEYWKNPQIGKIMTVQFNEIIRSKEPGKKPRLYLPVFIEIREDISPTA